MDKIQHTETDVAVTPPHQTHVLDIRVPQSLHRLAALSMTSLTARAQLGNAFIAVFSTELITSLMETVIVLALLHSPTSSTAWAYLLARRPNCLLDSN